MPHCPSKMKMYSSKRKYSVSKKRRSRKCKYGKLKAPKLSKSGKVRVCKRKKRSTRKSRKCKYGKLKKSYRSKKSGKIKRCKRKKRSSKRKKCRRGKTRDKNSKRCRRKRRSGRRKSRKSKKMSQAQRSARARANFQRLGRKVMSNRKQQQELEALLKKKNQMY